ncbi:hypothetical protein HAHE_37230 [Haloferula helveola]|uniref:Transposase IS200-like domain-containing protein n=1 Tax=Haloferula helveola TaxID=490095 RepID=A0ABM7RHV0_9BACT|nr:hypothetical protein HAHE_37230 [Haloferula helveola]
MSTWPAIRFLHAGADIRHTLNRLPHWQQEGACYFLTFRLADSLPSTLLNQWRDERTRWMAFHPQPWDEKTELTYHRRFSTRIDHWLDAAHGECRLRHPEVSRMVAKALRHYDRGRYLLHSSVIMPNHVHLLVSLAPDRTLEHIVTSWKSFTAVQANRIQGRSGPFWQRDYFDRLIRHHRHFGNVVRYIRKNSVSDSRSHLYEAEWVKEGLPPGARSPKAP